MTGEENLAMCNKKVFFQLVGYLWCVSNNRYIYIHVSVHKM